MSVLSFFRRTKSRYADDKAVAGQKNLLPQQSAFEAAMEDDAKERAAFLREIEKLSGSDIPIQKIFGDD